MDLEGFDPPTARLQSGNATNYTTSPLITVFYLLGNRESYTIFPFKWVYISLLQCNIFIFK